MAYICEDCRLYFSRRSSNCPHCGRRPTEDSRSEAELQAQGYRSLTLPAPSRRHTNRAVIHDDDLLAGLRRDYERQHTSSSHTASAESSTRETVPPPPPEPQPEEDFFAHFREEQPQPRSTPQIDLDPPERPAVRTRDPWEAPSHTWHEPPRARRTGTFSRLGRSAASIPWPLMLRIGFVILVIALLVTLWTMRWALLQGILTLFTTLLPVLLIVWLVWYIIRGGRRR